MTRIELDTRIAQLNADFVQEGGPDSRKDGGSGRPDRLPGRKLKYLRNL